MTDSELANALHTISLELDTIPANEQDAANKLDQRFAEDREANLAFAHDIETPLSHRASGDVATQLALLGYQPRRRKPYLYELLRNAGLLTTRQRPRTQ